MQRLIKPEFAQFCILESVGKTYTMEFEHQIYYLLSSVIG